ncbi:xylose isomerase domain protein TIM barrel protein, putative (macronuclear) [Tetrahymena thermophila SB210]|uniref:Xylose isomerase domain protein TIM barrel protein, putative n=1 Tax=Tetrahymena thermophila (strain SB210) TaxID=312017 RepID=Q23TE0_TETTS|nr:xylose isomerase domain protein TIM barrel protein, putative [Tetrahymena thermophila SB210]EAR99766.1 xylose isomerase domain protein TIM barrel protein, putative [Tetrahymena thermophila SB210]|eukprot:XP_001020011.1 xylose isomerase domain protein TIM barrel protein, putative [Tetrahymena thermophila SB210]
MKRKYIRNFQDFFAQNSEKRNWGNTFKNLKEKGYQGIEIPVQFSIERNQLDPFKTKNRHGFDYVAEIYTCGYPIYSSDINAHLDSFKKGIDTALKINPSVINVHSGRDCWTIDQTLEFFTKVQQFQEQLDVPINHETCRQRSLYNPYITKLVVQNCPNIYLNLDLSHWVLIGERLYDREKDVEFFEAFNTIKQNTRQVNARIGSVNQIQVIDPGYDDEILKWYDQMWKEITQAQEIKGQNSFYFSCKFGPEPYQINYLNRKKQAAKDIIKSNDFMLAHLMQNHK